MPTDLERQLPRFAEMLDRAAPTITVDEILDRAGPDVGVNGVLPSLPVVAGGDGPAEWVEWVEVEGSDEVPSSRQRRGLQVVLAAAAVALVIGLAVVVRSGGDPAPTDTPATTTPGSTIPATTIPLPVDAFVGRWLSTDTDGSSQTMDITRSDGADDGEYEVIIRDEVASVACDGGSSVLAGDARSVDDTSLVIATPELTCDNGVIPPIGPPPQAELADFALDLDAPTDQLVDVFGIVWYREGSGPVTIEPSAGTPPDSGSAVATVPKLMWPQATLEEVRAAQASADDGVLVSSWQLDAGLVAEDYPGTWDRLRDGEVELVDRFLREVMGWEAYLQNGLEGGADGSLADQTFLRCAPDRTNPLYPGEACAPTIDELTYESVSFDLVQPERKGEGGIWVVSDWRSSTFTQVDPAIAETQATRRLEEFLAARVAGEGAEGLVDVYDNWPVGREIPLLYATTSGAPFERYEFGVVSGPSWPLGGYITFSARLFADGGATIVEQEIYSHWDGGRSAGVTGGLAMERHTTTENGELVPVPQYFLDDQVVAWVAGPWSWFIDNLDAGGAFIDFSDPVAGDPVEERDCAPGMGPADAAEIAEMVVDDPRFVSTSPVLTTIGGRQALSMDVALAPGVTLPTCRGIIDAYFVWIYALEPGWRQRLYLVDMAEGMSLQTLAITVTAPAETFDDIVEQTQIVIDSIEFHTR